MNTNDWINKRIILEGIIGSLAYGTQREGSDRDYRGIVVPPREYIVGLKTFEQYESKDPDRVLYNIYKWAKLAIKGNPNVLEILWIPENYYVNCTKQGRMLIENRDLFLGKHLKKPYIGYAMDQLNRMQKIDVDANLNSKRAKMIERFGFDCKNAMHVVRLMRMCFEIFTERTLYVQRYDARDLLDILEGKWSYNKVIDEMRRLEHLVDEAIVTTSLPTKPDREKVNELIIEIVSEMI